MLAFGSFVSLTMTLLGSAAEGRGNEVEWPSEVTIVPVDVVRSISIEAMPVSGRLTSGLSVISSLARNHLIELYIDSTQGEHRELPVLLRHEETRI